MLILAGTLLAIALVPLLGGRLAGLARLRLDSGWLIGLALGLQVLSISVFPSWPRPLLVVMHGASYALAAWFVWRNRKVPGLPVLALGGFLNAFTIALNGGTLPASESALRKAGLPLTKDEFVNSGVLEDPQLPFLGDVFASPSWLPLQNVYSIGDLLILAGAVWAVHRTCDTVLARAPRLYVQALRGPAQVPVEQHLDLLDVLDEVTRERDRAVAALTEAGARNDELRRELVRVRQVLTSTPTPASLPRQAVSPETHSVA